MDFKENDVARQGLRLVFALAFVLLCFYPILHDKTWIIYYAVMGAKLGLLLIPQKYKMDRKVRAAVRQGIRLLFPLSFALLCFYQIVHYEMWIIYCTVIGSGIVGFLLIRKTGDEMAAYIRTHRPWAAMCLCAALIITAAMHLDRNVLYEDVTLYPLPFLGIRPFHFHWMIFTIPALFYLLVWVWRKSADFFSSFWKGLDPTDRKLYIGVTVLASSAILIGYATDSGWFMQFDKVYSIDSGWCSQGLFPSLSYYNIRHPIMSIVTFPVWAIIHTVLSWFVPTQLLGTLCAACVQIINFQMLLLAGFMIQELSGSRWILPLYLVSSPVLLFTMFQEKYPAAIFFLVLYAYRFCREEAGTDLALVFSAGMMPTSAFLYAHEMIQKEALGRKAKRFLYTFVTGGVIILCTGRAHLLSPPILLEEVSSMANSFGMKGLSLGRCLFSLTKMAHGVFFCLPSTSEGSYIWTDILNSPSYLGAAVFAVMALGILTAPKDRFVRICAVWVGVSVLLFCGVQWSVHTSPLFSIYFTWAFIPLFQKGFQVIIEKLNWNKRITYSCLFVSMLIVNVSMMIDIEKFLQTLTF